MRIKFKKNKSQRGVALLYFAMIVGVMLGFLMLVVNTGMLIYQKIRLQTAVDLAAYAGASVQASYLGNKSSGEQSIKAINLKIFKRYIDLLNEEKFGSVAPWPFGFPDPGSCAAACMAASLANGQHAADLYKKAAADMEQYRQEITAILNQLPKVTQAVAEETLKLNIPDLAVDGGGLDANTSNSASEVIRAAQDSTGNALSKKKNAVLSFSSDKGMYLANVVAAVPHTFAYFGPMCFDKYQNMSMAPEFYCAVNGSGAPGGPEGFNSAAQAFANALTEKFNPMGGGNIGNINKISDPNTRAIRLQFIQNPHRPDPFFMVAAEWYPENGAFLNIENSLGAQGSLFPKQTRLVAVAAAEPFGGDLVRTKSDITFGVRLQAIRKVLLDPRIAAVKSDYPNLFDYMTSLSPKDNDGKPIDKTAEDTIKRFLH